MLRSQLVVESMEPVGQVLGQSAVAVDAGRDLLTFAEGFDFARKAEPLSEMQFRAPLDAAELKGLSCES